MMCLCSLLTAILILVQEVCITWKFCHRILNVVCFYHCFSPWKTEINQHWIILKVMCIPTVVCKHFWKLLHTSCVILVDCHFLSHYLLLILKSTEESFIADFRHWVIPFLERLGKRKKKSQVNLIHQYLTDVAKVS